MRISLNLATRPFVNTGPAIKRLRIAMAVLAVLAIGLGLGLRAFHQRAVQARATEQSLQAKIDAINNERKRYDALMHQPDNAQFLTQVVTLNQLFEEKSFSWTLAMEDLETVQPGGVQTTSLEPLRDAKTGNISVKLRVVGPRDLAIQLVRNLEHSRHFLLPTIAGENSEATGGPNQRLGPATAADRFNFDLLVNYNPAAPQELGHHEHHAAEKSTPALVPVPTPVAAQRSFPPIRGPLSGQSRPPYTGQPTPQFPRGPQTRPNQLPGGPR